MDEEVLTRAIELAIKNGWEPKLWDWVGIEKEDDKWTVDLTRKDELYGTLLGFKGVYELIYSHDFARALWQHNQPEFWDLRGVVTGRKCNGSAETLGSMANEDFVPAWQWHLMRMVISPDPLQYLADNLPEEK